MKWKKIKKKTKEKHKSMYISIMTPKYLGINLTQMCKFSTQESFEMLFTEIQEIDNWGGISHSWIGKFYFI